MKFTTWLLALGVLFSMDYGQAQNAPIPRGPQDRPAQAPPRGSRAILDQETLERRQQYLDQNQRRIERETRRQAPGTEQKQIPENMRPDGHSWD